MSTTIGNLAVILSANAAGFTAGFAAATKSVGTFTGMVGNLTKTAAALVGIGSAVSVVTTAFKGFTNAEESTLTFQALLGVSAAKAKQFKGELKDFSDMTPFGDGVGAAAKELLKFNFGQEQVIPTLRVLGDIAAGVNVPLEELAGLVAENGYRANITSKQLIGMSHMGIPIMQELTKTTGLSQAAITELAVAGELKFEHLMAAMKSATSTGGAFFGMLEARANTTKGLMARIVDQTGDVIGKLGSVLGNRISAMFGTRSAMGAIFDWLQRVEEGVKNMGPWFDNVILVFQTVGDVVESVWTGVSQVFNWVFENIATGFGTIERSVGSFRSIFIESMLSVRFVFQNFGDYFKVIFGRVALQLWGFGEDFVHLFTVNIPEVTKWFMNTWRLMWDYVVAYAKFAWAKFSNWFQNAGNEFDLGLAVILEKMGVARQGHAKAHFDKMVAAQAAQVEPVAPAFAGVPKFAVTRRDPSDAEKGFAANLDALDKKLAQKRDNFFAAMPGAVNFIPGVGNLLGMGLGDMRREREPLDIGGISIGKRATDIRYAGAFESGSKEAYNVLVRSRDIGQAPANRTAKAAEETAKNTKDMAVNVKKVADAGTGIVIGFASLDVGVNT